MKVILCYLTFACLLIHVQGEEKWDSWWCGSERPRGPRGRPGPPGPRGPPGASGSFGNSTSQIRAFAPSLTTGGLAATISLTDSPINCINLGVPASTFPPSSSAIVVDTTTSSICPDVTTVSCGNTSTLNYCAALSFKAAVNLTAVGPGILLNIGLNDAYTSTVIFGQNVVFPQSGEDGFGYWSYSFCVTASPAYHAYPSVYLTITFGPLPAWVIGPLQLFYEYKVIGALSTSLSTIIVSCLPPNAP